MNFSNILKALITSLCILADQAHAAIISSDLINTEYKLGNYADLQGLQWLSLDETAEYSRYEIESGVGGFTADGWRYATVEETGVLLNSLWDNIYDGWSSGNGSGASWFLDAFGALHLESLTVSGMSRQSSFYFGSSGECPKNGVVDPTLSCLGKVLDISSISGDFTTPNVLTGVDEILHFSDDLVGYLSDYEGLDTSFYPENSTVPISVKDAVLGSLLVRRVPEPPTFILLGLGLAGLGFSRRRAYS